MTAEIVIINQHGVAMAADSAVTIGNQKIINSAIKLFSLSRTEPVGIMVYGNANLLNVPWETLIKLYRKKHTNVLDKLENYGDGYIDFLKSKIFLFNDQQQDEWAKERIEGVFNEIVENIRQQMSNLQTSKQKISEQQVIDKAESLLSEYNEVLNNTDFAYNELVTDDLANKITKLTQECIDNIFPILQSNTSIKTLLLEIGKSVILRCTEINSSGIVIAGFGEEDIFPSVVTYEVYGIYDNKLLFRKLDEKTIINNNSERMQSAIIPFAQEDVVRSFLEGIHPELFEYSMNYTNEILNSLLSNTSDPKLRTNAEKISHSITLKIATEMEDFMSRHLLSPMINMIQALPKDDLASMAEALVNMTAFRRKMAFSSLETVGGPVDVAVISKGDGLVWVKRKHYFPIELNKHFFHNYFK